jgi:ABC-type glycerol-3-phosphate transport system permease component
MSPLSRPPEAGQTRNLGAKKAGSSSFSAPRGVVGDLILAVAILVAAVPILWLLVLSVQPERNIISRDWAFDLSLSNFDELFSPNNPFSTQLANSTIIVAGTVALCLGIGSLAGYALSLIGTARWLTRVLLLFAALLAAVPPMTLVPGLYITLDQLGILGTLTGLVLLNTVFQLPFAVLLMKVYFDATPDELREAALVDGAGDPRIFWSVMLPLVRPGLATVAVYTAIMAWNDFLFGLTMTSGGDTAPLTVGISSLVQTYETNWGAMAAAGTLAAVPILVLVAVANRQIVSGLTRGAVKG